MGRFKKGLFVGGLLGAGLVWLNTTKKGRETRDQILDHAATVYSKVELEIKDSDAWKNMTKSKYVAMVKENVDKYALENGMAKKVKDMVVKLLNNQWGRLKSEMGKK